MVLPHMLECSVAFSYRFGSGLTLSLRHQSVFHYMFYHVLKMYYQRDLYPYNVIVTCILLGIDW